VPRRSDARPNAIATTARLLQQQGYAATGLEQVLAESGAPKGSFYFHFPGGKEQLAVEALESSGAFVAAVVADVVAAADTPADALRAFAALQAEQLRTSDYALGCPVATTALEMSTASDAIREASRAALDSWIAPFAASLAEAGVDDPERLATLAVATLEGALVIARTRRDAAVVTELAEVVARQIEAATSGRLSP